MLYTYTSEHLFRPDVLELLGLMQKVIRVRLGHELALIGFLHKVFIPLLLREVDGIFLGLEV